MQRFSNDVTTPKLPPRPRKARTAPAWVPLTLRYFPVGGHDVGRDQLSTFRPSLPINQPKPPPTSAHDPGTRHGPSRGRQTEDLVSRSNSPRHAALGPDRAEPDRHVSPSSEKVYDQAPSFVPCQSAMTPTADRHQRPAVAPKPNIVPHVDDPSAARHERRVTIDIAVPDTTAPSSLQVIERRHKSPRNTSPDPATPSALDLAGLDPVAVRFVIQAPSLFERRSLTGVAAHLGPANRTIKSTQNVHADMARSRVNIGRCRTALFRPTLPVDKSTIPGRRYPGAR